jgi:hypothetical protein
VTALAESCGYWMRSKEIWERATNLGAWLLGWAYGLSGRQERPSGQHIVDVLYVEWMMGVPPGWTRPEGASLAG